MYKESDEGRKLSLNAKRVTTEFDCGRWNARRVMSEVD